jgi:hypothetical protein
MSTRPAPVLEIAVFTFRAPDAFPALQERTHEALATLPGHRAGLRLRGLTPGLFADLVAWDSLEAAQQASATVAADPRFAALLDGIAELRLHAHYRLGLDPATLLDALRRAPMVEVAAYAARDVALQREWHDRVHDALRALPGHHGGAPGQQVEDPEQFSDLVGWQDPEAHQRAGAALQGRDELSPFFAGLGALQVFELFSVLG